jgi:4-hydroxybenzoyl-CoA reductase subunit alpha
LASEVQVDIETGEVKIVKLWVAVDCGRVMNLAGLRGQVLGCRAMGIGNTFLEEYVYNDRGRMINSNFVDYKIPSALDVPPTEIFWVETMAPSNPYGAKGGGENSAIDTVAPATANAIYNAIGVRIRDLPITPDKILKALEAKRKGKEIEPRVKEKEVK